MQKSTLPLRDRALARILHECQRREHPVSRDFRNSSAQDGPCTKVSTSSLLKQARRTRREMSRYTTKQGQYLAFIFYYTKIHGRAPAESDMETYFKVSAPSVHQMVVTLERKRLIERTPGQARSIRLLLSREELPDLD